MRENGCSPSGLKGGLVPRSRFAAMCGGWRILDPDEITVNDFLLTNLPLARHTRERKSKQLPVADCTQAGDACLVAH